MQAVAAFGYARCCVLHSSVAASPGAAVGTAGALVVGMNSTKTAKLSPAQQRMLLTAADANGELQWMDWGNRHSGRSACAWDRTAGTLQAAGLLTTQLSPARKVTLTDAGRARAATLKTKTYHIHSTIGGATLGYERAASPEAAWAQLGRRVGSAEAPTEGTVIEPANDWVEALGVRVLFSDGVPVRVSADDVVDEHGGHSPSATRAAKAALVELGWPEARIPHGLWAGAEGEGEVVAPVAIY